MEIVSQKTVLWTRGGILQGYYNNLMPFYHQRLKKNHKSSNIRTHKTFTLVFSSTTLSPSADTHRTAFTAFFPVFEKIRGGGHTYIMLKGKQNSSSRENTDFCLPRVTRGEEVQAQEGCPKPDTQPNCRNVQEKTSQSDYFRNITQSHKTN